MTILPPDILFIQRGWVNSNSIVIRGDRGTTIVDTGHPQHQYETLALFEQNGVDLGKINLIVNTHCHWDHLGANRLLKSQSGAPVATSAATATILQAHDRHAMWLDYFDVDMEPLTVDIVWLPGDVVRLGNHQFEVVATPGHAPDSIALFQPELKLLLSADALHQNDCGILNSVIHGPQVLDDAIETAERLQALGATVALPGHGLPVTDVPASLAGLSLRLARFKAQPDKMARHLLRRVTMTGVLLHQPVLRSDYMAYALARPWPHDYGPLAGYATAAAALEDVLADFMERGLIRETDVGLISLIPR